MSETTGATVARAIQATRRRGVVVTTIEWTRGGTRWWHEGLANLATGDLDLRGGPTPGPPRPRPLPSPPRRTSQAPGLVHETTSELVVATFAPFADLHVLVVGKGMCIAHERSQGTYTALLDSEEDALAWTLPRPVRALKHLAALPFDAVPDGYHAQCPAADVIVLIGGAKRPVPPDSMHAAQPMEVLVTIDNDPRRGLREVRYDLHWDEMFRPDFHATITFGEDRPEATITKPRPHLVRLHEPRPNRRLGSANVRPFEPIRGHRWHAHNKPHRSIGIVRTGAIGIDGADAVQRVIDAQRALLDPATWTVEPTPPSSPTRQVLEMNSPDWHGTLTATYEPHDGEVVLEWDLKARQPGPGDASPPPSTDR